MSVFAIAWRLALLSLGLAAVVPTRTRSLGPHPNPAHDYAAAMQLAAAFQRGDSMAARGGESILLVHGARAPRAVVLFHGITNSPRQYHQLAAVLYESGDNVFVPRLPNQALAGGDADTLAGLRSAALRDVADQSLDIAAGLGDTVVALGLSLGGDMAAWVAQFRREADRVVVVSPALGLSRVESYLQAPVM